MKKYLLILLLFFYSISWSTIHYVTTTATAVSGAALTKETAWTLGYALGSQNSANGTNDTIMITAGRYDVYQLGAFYPGGVQVKVHGKSLAEPLLVSGEIVHGIWATVITENDSVHGLISALGANVTFQDLVFENTFDRVNASHYGGSLFTVGNNDGVPVPGIKVINNVARNAMVTGFADNSEGVGITYAWNIAYYNGKKVNNSNFGYAMYSQNGIRGYGYKHYKDNIFFDNWGRNAQMYGSSVTHIDSIHFSHNVFFQYANTTDANAMIDMTDGDGILDDPILDSCYFWTESVNGYGRTWRESNATNRALYRGNWMIKGTMYGSSNSTNRTMINNRYWGPVGPDNINVSNYPNNTWAVGDGDLTGDAMPIWADTVIVRINPYHTELAHVIVYNRTGGNFKSWDPQTMLTSGDSLFVYDVQNLFGAPVIAMKWNSGSISLPMNLTTVETPICMPAAKGTLTHTDSRFGVFLLYKKVNTVAIPVEEPPTLLMSLLPISISSIVR